MNLRRLIDALSDPAAYPTHVPSVEVRQTHISVVFLAGEQVFKIKKPVKLSFLDFSSLEKRRHFCEEEVRLNARLAREVYEGVVPIVQQGSGLKFGGVGDPVEWVVQMRRLPDDATLESRLSRGIVHPAQMQELARTIAQFHANAERDERISTFGRLKVVASNARANFVDSQAQIGKTISLAVFDRLSELTDQSLTRHADLIESRAARNVPCDTHGDLRTDHVYFLDNGNNSKTLVIDCIEFNEAFRFADPVADVAFLAMDLKFDGACDLADVFTNAYFDAAGDNEGRQLLSFYVAYRAAVRGKVEGLKQAESEVSAKDREESRQRARGYWLLALGELEPPDRRPCLILISGLPGSGKSTLAAELAAQASCGLIRSDVVRKQLSGQDETANEPHPFGTGTYSDAWNERTYAECLRRAETLLFEGRRVIVDASFREDARRCTFLAAAKRWKVPLALFRCETDSQTIQQRLTQRENDASDADWAIYQAAARAWEPVSDETAAVTYAINGGRSRQESLDAALKHLGVLGLVS